MNDYSIELSSEEIFDSRSKRNFSEVYGCYAIGHHRSAIVMLWSVVVTDILFKLEYLANLYSDQPAKDIIASVTASQKQNPRSSEWELTLVRDVQSKTELLDTSELTQLEQLQQLRHLSAHPVITQGDLLFTPNKETVRANIRNSLDAVLTKPPILGRKVFDHFTEDIAQLSQQSPDYSQISSYIDSKYLRQIMIQTIGRIFRSLWRVTFKSADAMAEENREINEQVLEVLFAKHTSYLSKEISDNPNYFSEISAEDDTLHIMSLFLSKNPGVYRLLTPAATVPIESHANLTADNFANCWFIGDSPLAHLTDLASRLNNGEKISNDTMSSLCQSLASTEALSLIFHCGIDLYFNSGSFNSADSIFYSLIKPCLNYYTRECFEEFLKNCSNSRNSQVFGRTRVGRDHKVVETAIARRFPDIDLNAYPRFLSSVS